MEPGQVELSSLMGWLRTFSLQSQAGSALELSDGEAMAEALVKIEPEVFTPSWFAGILQSSNSNKETLNSVLNLLLHYYRHNLGEDCASGELPVPVIPPDSEELSTEMVARFLKLMLGVAVTCSNKQTFIDKIQSLDETTQHALTACVASFIYTKEWTGRISAQSLNSELKMATPPGDEIWAQKCHELDFQVALLKEERSNLMVENEDLCEKVRAAQTLSRKDSVKARQFETELAHIKDEFERLRLAYESTKEHINAMEARLKPDAGDQTEKVKRLTKETAELRTELAGLKAGLSTGKGESGAEKWGEAGQVLGSLQEQREAIAELRSMIEYQAGVQAGLGREVNCLKDQVDILRESSYSYNRHEQELVEIRSRLSHFQLEGEDIAEILRGQNPNRTIMSLESETNLSSAGLNGDLGGGLGGGLGGDLGGGLGVGGDAQANSSLDQNQSLLSQRNNLLEETLVFADQRSPRLARDVTIHSELRSPRLTRESIHSESFNNSLHFVKTVPEVDEEEETSEEVRQLVEKMKPSLHEELRLLQASACSLTSPEQVDSGMDMTTESTPFTSRPESELVLPDGCPEDDVQATPRQLERLLEESNSGSSVSSTSPDSGLQLEDVQEVYVREQGMAEAEDTVMESRSLLRSTEDHVRLLEKEKAALVEEKEQLVRVSQELLGQVDNQLPFDPNDPKVKELEEWECSVSRSVIVEDYPRNRLAKLFKMKKRSPKLKLRRASYQAGRTIEEKTLLERRHFDDDDDDDEDVSVACVNSWLLAIFVKVFD